MNDHHEDVKHRVNSQGSYKNDDVLVPDARAQLTPAQMVERKLVSTLQRCPLMVSQLQTSARYRFN
jgi:hypothetical protein